jgi:hypothetical protein
MFVPFLGGLFPPGGLGAAGPKGRFVPEHPVVPPSPPPPVRPPDPGCGTLPVTPVPKVASVGKGKDVSRK